MQESVISSEIKLSSFCSFNPVTFIFELIDRNIIIYINGMAPAMASFSRENFIETKRFKS